MRIPATALFIACALLSAESFAAKPSYNCAKASHDAEKLVCEDDELAALDVKLSKLYNKVMKATPAATQKRLKAEQSGWMKGRNDCWKSSDQRSCIKSAYDDRISELTKK